MKNITTHRETLISIRRLPSSRNGNPRYELFIGSPTSGFHCCTAVDSSLAYKVPNYLGKRVVVTIGTHYGVPTLNTIRLEH